MTITLTLVAVGLLVALGGQAWLLLQAGRQQGRLGDRLDGLAGRLSTRAADAAALEHDRLFNSQAGTVAPPFDLAELGGGRVSLTSLLAPAKPLLLVATDPKCGPCYELLPDVGGWQRVYGDRLTIALVSSGEPKMNLAMTAEYGVRPVLLQDERELADAYGLAQLPAAVVIQPDGRVSAGPRYGANAVRQLVAETLGLAMPEAPSQELQVVGIGRTAPSVRRPDLDGNTMEVVARDGEPTLLLFWSPGCSHCQAILPEIRAFEALAQRPRLVIVSRGPVGLNQEAGFASPVVLDDDRSLARLFDASGTPAAVLLSGRGVVVTQVARGGEGVRAALQALQETFAPALTAG
jgi:thiol-disulfide isomerase/thioredoxin